MAVVVDWLMQVAGAEEERRRAARVEAGAELKKRAMVNRVDTVSKRCAETRLRWIQEVAGGCGREDCKTFLLFFFCSRKKKTKKNLKMV